MSDPAGTAGMDSREQRNAGAAGSADRGSSRVARLARRLGGFAAVASLAGCSSDGPDGSEPPTGTFYETEEGTPPGGWNTPTPSDLSAAECRSRLEDIEETAEAAHMRRDSLDQWIESAERTLETLELSRDRWETFGDEVVADAEVVAEEARPAVVFVDIDSVAGHGTGWYVDEHHIMTNAHVVSDAPVSAWTIDGERREVSVVDYVEDLNPDVAVLRTEESAPATLSVDGDARLSVDDPLVQVGHPGGTGNWFASLGAYKTTLSPEKDPNVNYETIITTVPSRGGSSGSPVLTLDGTVVAMTSGSLSVQFRGADQPPIPAPERVFDRGIPKEALSSDVPISRAVELYERWT